MAEPASPLLGAATSLLCVIDIQARLLPAMAEPDRVTRNAARLLAAADRLGVRSLVTEQYPAGIGHTVAALMDVLPATATVMEKTWFSALREPGIAARVDEARAQGARQVVVCGIEAHVCVLQFCLDCKASGVDVFLVADAVSARRPDSVDIALRRAERAGIVPVTTEMVLFEWLERAGTPQFRDMLPMIRDG